MSTGSVTLFSKVQAVIEKRMLVVGTSRFATEPENHKPFITAAHNFNPDPLQTFLLQSKPLNDDVLSFTPPYLASSYSFAGGRSSRYFGWWSEASRTS